MLKLIENFPKQLENALKIGGNYTFKLNDFTPKNVIICGLGGSGIGGSFVKDAVINEISVPIEIVKSYNLPAFVNEESLVIISSYSGNTEEALSCFKEALAIKAKVIAVSSNGQVEKIARDNQIDFIQIPGGMPPRACLGYSAVQLFYILHHLELIDDSFEQQIKATKTLLEENTSNIKEEAKELANKLFDKIPVLYSENTIESVTVRWRQQINENGKQLCWHHVVPEMNHNELVGWRQKNENLAVVFLRNQNDFENNQKRMELNKLEYEKYTSHIFEVWSMGSSFIEKALYLIHVGDYVSYYLSQLRGFDATEVNVIDRLKANLVK